jgi:carbamoyl-phosphate synthase small subunit
VSEDALLVLEDGRSFSGRAFGAVTHATGEVCFNTSMTGYQEILTDPSYRGQIVAMTYPEIGNYGANFLDQESRQTHLRGFVVAELSPVVSNWRAEMSLAEYLTQQGVPGIQGVDTRALTKHLRTRGAMRGCLTTNGLSEAEALAAARAGSGVAGMDFVQEVTPDAAALWDETGQKSPAWMVRSGSHTIEGLHIDPLGNHFSPLPPTGARVVAVDFGSKANILRLLRQQGLAVELVPATTPAAEILAREPQGVLLSNGPGDPAALDYAHRTVRELIGQVPVYGICLGHQIIACALGGRTFKLKFGHRGANHPVQNLQTREVAITSQNHGFAVDPASLPPEVEVTHINLNDGTVAGLRHREYPVHSVQFHPEAAPGPHDSRNFFREFAKVVEDFVPVC